MSSRPLSLPRYMRVQERQGTPAWGSQYRAAIEATPEEAPRISRPSILRPAKLGGRKLHLLSLPERAAALLALHHPDVIDLQEQRALSVGPAPHPLAGHPLVQGRDLKHVSGTVAVTAALDCLSRHPRIFVDGPDDTGYWLPFPYIGDLLLIVRGADGVYCVNWNIKKSAIDYTVRPPLPFGRVRKAGTPPSDLRHRIEEAYYGTAGIRTVRVCGDAIDDALVNNLLDLFSTHAGPVPLEAESREALESALRDSIGSSRTALSVLREQAPRLGMEFAVARTVMRQAIWARRLRVELFRPLLIDQPLRSEQRDPIAVYADWFEE